MRSRAPQRWFVAVSLLLAVTFALSLRYSLSHSNTMNQMLNITIGQQGAEVVKHSPVPIKRSGVNGLRMYDAGKPFKDLGATVVLKEDYSAIAFPPVEHLAFYEEGSMGGGIDEIALDLLLPRLPKSRTDTRAWAEYEDTAFKLVQNTIDRINAAGWQRWISFSDPRLSGRDTIDFVPGYRNRAYTAEWQDMWGVDPSYRMTREDWDNLSERWPHWYWIKHGATIELRYEKDDRGPEKPPLFDTLRVTIRSADTTSGWLYGPTKGDWKTYKQSEMTRKLAARKKSEAAARAAGAKIFEAYKDYPIGGVRLPEIEQ